MRRLFLAVWTAPRRLAWLIFGPPRYQPRHELAELADLEAPRTEPIAFLGPEVETLHTLAVVAHELGSLRVWEPDPRDAVFDYALSWDRAWRQHQHGDENAIQDWLDAGWIADAWWIRRRESLAVAA